MRQVVLAALCLGSLLVPSSLQAQDAAAAETPWTFRTRAIITGVSDSSEPAGYKVYSAFAMEADLSRRLSRVFTLAMILGTESREVEFTPQGGPKVNLGSIEVLPLNVLLQFRPHLGGRFHPYVGAGANLSTFWEKSGQLDSMDLAVGLGPVIEVGMDLDLSPRTVFSVEFRVVRLETDLEDNGRKVASVALHPTTLGVGVGFKF